MANVFVNENTLTLIANAIRTKLKSSDKYKPSEMPIKILSIQTGGDSVNTIDCLVIGSNYIKEN